MTDTTKNFTRKELIMLIGRAEILAERVPNPHWKSAYSNLVDTLDRLDAMLARSGADIS